MADWVTVANLALNKLGEDDQVRDPDQDGHAARTIRAVWDAVRRKCLRRGKYNFSVTRAELAAQAEGSPGWVSPYPYAYRFPLPTDCLRLIEILGPASVVDCYVSERRGILANSAGPVFIRYVADIVETGLWDDLFVEEFASELAWQIAPRITGSLEYRESARRDKKDAKRDAAGVDAKEDPPIPYEDSSWITARFDRGWPRAPNT